MFKNKKTKIIFRTTSGKKICKINFSKEQFDMIEKAAVYNNQTVDEFFHDLLKELTNHVKKDIKR
jgi:hypothetical protein